MKSLLTITKAEFELSLPRLSFGQLKGLLRGIYEFKSGRLYGKVLSEEILCDIERKETTIWREFQRRGILKKGHGSRELQDWLSKFRTKRIF